MLNTRSRSEDTSVATGLVDKSHGYRCAAHSGLTPEENSLASKRVPQGKIDVLFNEGVLEYSLKTLN